MSKTKSLNICTSCSIKKPLSNTDQRPGISSQHCEGHERKPHKGWSGIKRRKGLEAGDGRFRRQCRETEGRKRDESRVSIDWTVYSKTAKDKHSHHGQGYHCAGKTLQGWDPGYSHSAPGWFWVLGCPGGLGCD